MAGKYFDEWQVGDTLTHDIRRTVTETDNLFFTTMTHNPQPLHLVCGFVHQSSMVEYRRDTPEPLYQIVAHPVTSSIHSCTGFFLRISNGTSGAFPNPCRKELQPKYQPLNWRSIRRLISY